jgi:adenine C2-methylase RlmN of 23S rRNA A2503 and tRNA A37
LNNLVLDSESLNNVLENKSVSRQDIVEIYQKAVENPNDLFLVSQNLRKKFKKNTDVLKPFLLQGNNQSRNTQKQETG